MEAENKALENVSTSSEAGSDMASEAAEDFQFVAQPPGHSLLDVLMPATPPVPKNARVIRLFDYEAAKHDPRPPAEPAAIKAPVDVPAPSAETKKEAAKAARNQSLLAAAKLF